MSVSDPAPDVVRFAPGVIAVLERDRAVRRPRQSQTPGYPLPSLDPRRRPAGARTKVADELLASSGGRAAAAL